MTKKVEISPRGKVVGIRGLYKDLSSGRYYVRYSFKGVDKQFTIFPQNQTFSGLEKSAAKGMTALKKMVCETVSQLPEKSFTSEKDKILLAQNSLIHEIKEIWGKRGCSQRHVIRLIRSTNGLCLCSSSKPADIRLFNVHNVSAAKAIVEDNSASANKRNECYKSILSVFNDLIKMELHHGCNPALFTSRPKTKTGTRKTELDFDMAAKVYTSIWNKTSNGESRLETCLFLRLCVETGQRPIDIHMFDAGEITQDNRYLFSSHKTGNYHRVQHLLSDGILNLISELNNIRSERIFTHSLRNRYSGDEVYTSIWRFGVQYYEKRINTVIKEFRDDGTTLYNARHFFVSEMFRRTNSDLWAEVFTHEAKTSNAKHYLHVDQEDADELIRGIHNSFKSSIVIQSHKTLE